jgi:D-alanyl-D-alanine carboxypeptidase
MLAVLLLPMMLACGSDSAAIQATDLGPDGVVDADVPVGDTVGDAPDSMDPGTPPPEFSAQLATSLQALLDEHVAFSPDPGLTLTVRTADGAWWTGAAGMSDIAAGKKMTEDSQFRVGSNTKPIVAATVLQLVEEGKIDLEAPLTTYLPEYAEWSDITVRLLLNMRSGLPEYLGLLSLVLQLVADPTVAVTPQEILQAVREAPRDFAPDTAGKYTNSSYLVLGLIIEKVTGNAADVEINARIIQPLGLEHTYLDMGTLVNPDLAQGYIDFSLAGPALGLPSSTEGLLPDTEYTDGLLIGTNLLHPTVNWTAGALVSTSRDMAILIHALMDGNLLKPESIVEMKKTVVASLFNGPVLYGLGLQTRATPQGDVYGHGGLNFGYQAATYFFPDSGVTISHLHNFLLDSYDSFQNEMMSLILAGGEPAFTPCLAPADFYKTYDTGAYLNVAFKGRVNGAADEPRIQGNASLRLATADGPLPFTGIFPSATLGSSAAGPNITITGYGLDNDTDADVVVTSLVLNETLFAGLDADGRKELAMANLGDMFLLVARAWYAPGSTTVVDRMCYKAVSDYQRIGEARVCAQVETLPGKGDMLRVFGSIPYLDDPVKVAGLLGQIGIPACSCLQIDATWAACD